MSTTTPVGPRPFKVVFATIRGKETSRRYKTRRGAEIAMGRMMDPAGWHRAALSSAEETGCDRFVNTATATELGWQWDQ